MTHTNTLLRGVVLGAVAALATPVFTGGRLEGQAAPAAAAANPSEGRAQRRVIAKTIFGEAAVAVNARSDGYIEVGLAGPNRTVVLKLPTLASRAWVDSAGRVLRFRPRRSNEPRVFTSPILEPETKGSMALTRTVEKGVSKYQLSFADERGEASSVEIADWEAKLFVSHIRKAAAESAKMMEPADSAAALADSAAKPKQTPAPKGRRQPAAKAPAKAPAKSPATTPAKAPATGATPDSGRKP